MSLSALSAPTPSRLLRRRGRWALEVTRFVAVDDKVLEPRAQRVEGSEAILRQLRHTNDHGALAQGALQLMRALRGEDDRSFVVVEGEWVPSSDGAGRPGGAELELKMQLDDLRAELLLLRASHQRLRDRVAALEARLEHAEPKPQRRAPSHPAPPLESNREEDSPHAAAAPLPAPLAEAAPERTQQSAGLPAAAPPLNPFREAVAVLAAPDAGPERPLVLPEAAQISAALTELCGGDSGLSASDEAVPDSALELAALYAGRFVDDDGNDLGVLLAELRLVAHIGGKLMGLPSTVIEEQARTGVLSEQVLLAMSEVVNTLSNTVSELSGNPHVRGCPIEPFPPDRLEWLARGRQRVALSRSRVGTLWLLAR